METNAHSDLNPEEAINPQEENTTGQETPVENNVEDTAAEHSIADQPLTEGEISVGSENETETDSESKTEPIVIEPVAEAAEVQEKQPEVPEQSEEAPTKGVDLIIEAVETLAEEKETVDAPISEEPLLSSVAAETLEESPEISKGPQDSAEFSASSIPPDSGVVQKTADENDESDALAVKSQTSTEIQIVPALISQKSSVMDDEDEESDEAEEEDNTIEEETNFAEMTRLQLVEKLEELVKEEDITKIKVDVGQIKMAFLKLNKEFKHDAYQKLAEQNEDAETENVDSAGAQHLIADDEIEIRYKEAFDIYKRGRAAFNEKLEKEKTANLEEKNKILEELKVLISSEETLKKTYDEFKILQDKWKTIGMVPKGDVNTLWQNYHFLVEKFFDKVKINKELKDLDLKKNLEAKIVLCERAEELLLEKSIIKSFKQLQQYHEDWKEIGPVPQDKKDEIWERFRAATDQINERRHEYYAEMQESFEQNLAAKQILCEKAEQLLQIENDSIKSWQDTTNKVTELLQLWKSLGPAPKKQNNEIWTRFKTSLDGFFNAKKDYYSVLKEQQLHNFNVKLDLCVQAEALRTSTNWKNTTRELINLQNEWKKVGPVPRKQSDRIWKRFRAACDEFFKTKNEYFSNVQSHEGENLKLKLDLIEQVKGFEVGEDRNLAIETLKSFQRQWMDIGFVPIKEKERLQTEFRAIINKHFEKLKVDSMTSGATNYRNRIDRMAKDSPDAGRVISKERGSLQGKIQQLQEDIKLWENNIGFFANSKTANLLKLEFEKKIEQAKDELQMLEIKMKALREAGN